MSTPLIDAGQHQLDIDLPAGQVVLDVDRHRIAQVLSNLVNNAAKYTPARGRIAVRARREPDRLVLSVSDNGIGIDAAMLPLVFDMYAQAHRHQGAAQGGLGVGLNLVRRLVELHGGSVSVHSAGANRGSCFTVYLPCNPSAAPPGAGAPAGAAGGAALVDADSRRILVVDDNVDAADMLGALLELRGHTVCIEHDGAAAIARAAAFLPHVVFLDIGLPDQSGYEVAPLLRKIAGMERASLVALTGWGAPQDRQRAHEAGFDAHLTKPADLANVEAVLGRVAAHGQAGAGGHGN